MKLGTGLTTEDSIMIYDGFRKNHVFMIGRDKREDLAQAKRRAETRFIKRQPDDKNRKIVTNTLLLITREQLLLLYGEVMHRQEIYQASLDAEIKARAAAAKAKAKERAAKDRTPYREPPEPSPIPIPSPTENFWTDVKFEYFIRTGKSAILCSAARLHYGVNRDANMWKISHLEGMG